jgi:chromosome partitioning protein
MRTIAFLNQKGGVGKTTTAVNVGIGMVRLGRRVVLVDLDPQGHLTRSLGVEPGGTTLYEVVKGLSPLSEILAPVEGAQLVPASLELSGVDTEFAARPGKERLVAEALSGLSGQTGADALILDCPPNLGLLTVNALAMAGEVVIPVQAEYLSLASLGGLMDTLEAAHAFNPGLRILGIVLTRYNHRKRLCREVAGAIRSHFPDLLFETRIRESVALAEAPGFGQSIFAYSPRSQGALDFANLSREIDARGGA